MFCAGIGLATVKRLASEGAAVYIFDINQSAGEKESGDLRSKSLNVHYLLVDVSDKSACLAGTKKVAEENNGALHYLVNCAAYFGCKGLTAEKADWDKSFGVNVIGYSNMVQSCYELMNKIPGVKAVVNIASISGHITQPVHWTYNATKGAILTMTKCMALDLAKDGIRVNSISPGWVWTPEVIKAAGGEGGREKWEPIWGHYHMLDRFCECSEVAAAVCFLLSDDASYITGQWLILVVQSTSSIHT